MDNGLNRAGSGRLRCRRFFGEGLQGVGHSNEPMAELPLVLPASRPGPITGPERADLVRRARLLAWGGNVWHGIEFAVALAAGLAAGSIALIGFGLDSLIEAGAGAVILWRFRGLRSSSEPAERRAQQLIAASYFPLVVVA